MNMAKLKKPKQIFPIVEVLWEDITSQDGGWIKPGHDNIDPCMMTSVGYLVMDTPAYIVYASDLAEDGTTNGRTQVPRANVKQIKILRKVRNAKIPPVQN